MTATGVDRTTATGSTGTTATTGVDRSTATAGATNDSHWSRLSTDTTGGVVHGQPPLEPLEPQALESIDTTATPGATSKRQILERRTTDNGAWSH